MMTDATTTEHTQPSDRIQVSSHRPMKTYKKNILRNTSRSGHSKPVTLTGLGDATKKAIELSNELLKHDFIITDISTQLHSSTETRKTLPKITVTLCKYQPGANNDANTRHDGLDGPGVPIEEAN